MSTYEVHNFPCAGFADHSSYLSLSSVYVSINGRPIYAFWSIGYSA